MRDRLKRGISVATFMAAFAVVGQRLLAWLVQPQHLAGPPGRGELPRDQGDSLNL
jgi:hypothetical protein